MRFAMHYLFHIKFHAIKISCVNQLVHCFRSLCVTIFPLIRGHNPFVMHQPIYFRELQRNFKTSLVPLTLGQCLILLTIQFFFSLLNNI